MADMTITITVTGRIGGNNISWSRTAVVTGILGAVNRIGEGTRADAALEYAMSSETPNQARSGLYSTGAAVMCVVHSGQGAQAAVYLADSAKNDYRGPVITQGVPFIAYNGAGANGFNGGINNSATAADTPTVDIDYAIVRNLSGHAPWSSLVGLKLIS